MGVTNVLFPSVDNQIAFERFLDTCLGCASGAEVVAAIQTLDAHKIKGLGPLSARIF